MKKGLVLMIAAVLVLGFSGISSAIDDPGANYGPIDLTSAVAEVYDRGDINLLKLSITSSPSLPAAVMFECDVDNSTGTGGSNSMLGSPVSPCPCKTEPGFDIITAIFIRQQGDGSGSAIAASCSDNQGACGRRRESGEWYAVTSLGGQPIRSIGILRGYLDPTPKGPASGVTEDCYTLPWSHIIAYAQQNQNETTPDDPKNFNYVKARTQKCTGTETSCLTNDDCTAPATCDSTYADGKWQVSIWYDPTADQPGGDEDDVASGVFPTQTFDINDYAPDVGKADMIKSLGATDLTYCEGNFDGDKDVDGGDAAKFKANFGRSPFKNPCPACGPNF